MIDKSAGTVLAESAHKVLGMGLDELREFNTESVSDSICKKLAYRAIRGDNKALQELKELIRQPEATLHGEQMDELSVSLYEFEQVELEVFWEMVGSRLERETAGDDQK